MSEKIDEIEVMDTDDYVDVYDNKIQFYFEEYFDRRNIDITGTNFKTVPSSCFFSALNYVSDKLFRIRSTDIRYNNKKTRIDLKDIDYIEEVTNIYINIIKTYSLIPRIIDYCDFLCIDESTFYVWNNQEFDKNGLSIRYYKLTEKVKRLGKSQTFHKLSDDRVGTITIANYDTEISLNYAESKSKLSTQGTIQALNSTELPSLTTLD